MDHTTVRNEIINPHQFFPITSANERISSKNFLTFTFNPFATLVLNFKAITSASQKIGFSCQILIKLRL